MGVMQTIEMLQPLTERDVKTLCGPHLLTAFERARDGCVQLERIGTHREKVASANLVLLRAEVLRRLEAFRS